LPFPERTAGEPIAFSFDAATRVFHYQFHPAAGVTSISIPTRTWPEGYQVDCPGCQTRRTARGLEISAAQRDPAILELRPGP
jgi:hypothetical protein